MPIRNRNIALIIVLFACLILGGISFIPSNDTKPEEGLYRKPILKEEKMTQKDAAGILKTIESSDCVYYGRIGIAGQESIVYNFYCILKDGLSDSSWLELWDSPSPNVRLYSLTALKYRKSPLYAVVKKKLSTDTAIVCVVSGCTSMSISIRNYIAFKDK